MRNKRVAAVLLIAMAVVVTAGGLMASNMGFKLNYPLAGSGAGSQSGTQTIGLPYNRQVGIDTASQLLADIQASGVGATALQKYNPVLDSNDPYPGLDDFALEAGVGYLIGVSPGGDGDYIIVGSHDPGLTVEWKGPASGVSQSGTQRYAHPYHGVAATASALLAETGADSMQTYNSALDSLDPYPGLDDFALVPGESYLVITSSDISFIPAHY